MKDLLEAEIFKLEGVIHVNYNTKNHQISVNFRQKNTSLRSIIQHANSVSPFEVTYIPEKSDKGDIRIILKQEVLKYRNKFVISFAVLIPIMILMWVVPYTETSKSFLTDFDISLTLGMELPYTS